MSTYQRVRHHEIYRNPWISAEVHEIVHPTGVAGEHLLVVPPRASGVVIMDGDACIFTLQPRFAAGCEVIEIVKGGAELGESAIACAQRELREELGYEAASWRNLGECWEIPSIVAPPVALFVASDIRRVGGAPEPNECISEVRLSRSDVIAAMLDGRISDALTIAALARVFLAKT
ncbi:MAG: NUDIX hydrolase [Vulcanimicrobiaceae bacterium]